MFVIFTTYRGENYQTNLTVIIDFSASFRPFLSCWFKFCPILDYQLTPYTRTGGHAPSQLEERRSDKQGSCVEPQPARITVKSFYIAINQVAGRQHA